VKFLNNKFIYQDSLSQKAFSCYVKGLNKGFEKELDLEKEISYNKEKLHDKHEGFLIVVALLFIAIIFSLLLLIKNKVSKQKRINQENTITKLKLQNTELEKQKLNEILKTKQKDIVNIVTNGSMRVNFLNSILKKIKKQTVENNAKETVKSILFDIKSQINIEKRHLALQSDLTNANAHFESKLMTNFSNLTKSEREICTYIRLNFSSKEITQIRNSSIDSVKMTRSRIRKKLQLDSKTELNKAIQSI
jgi:DNA-binding CsgD family transcriptional regulator